MTRGGSHPFDLTWQAHFAYTNGHSIKCDKGIDPPKLLEAVLLFESEKRAREALTIQKQNNEREKRAIAAKHQNARLVVKK